MGNAQTSGAMPSSGHPPPAMNVVSPLDSDRDPLPELLLLPPPPGHPVRTATAITTTNTTIFFPSAFPPNSVED
jgi:hypothetical protein